MQTNNTLSNIPIPSPAPRKDKFGAKLLNTLNLIVLAISVLLLVWISLDTFKGIPFLENHPYMTFQFWVCVVFILDFFVQLYYAENRWKFFRKRLFFLLLSIPYLNIINAFHIELSHDAIYFVRFVPMARAALAISIVMGYVSSNSLTSMFMSYLSMILMVTYFCSLIFFQRESGVNPDVTSYWIALWWSAMNVTTVGCDIAPMTLAGKVVAVILPICGMIIFPLFTVYITNYVSGAVKAANKRREEQDV